MRWSELTILAAAACLGFGATATAQDLVRERIYPSSAPAASIEFMGVQIGSELVAECRAETAAGLAEFYRMTQADAPCWMSQTGRPGSQEAPRNVDSLPLLIVRDKRPEGTNAVRALVIDGRVEGLWVDTDGFVHQARLLEQLTRKLGTPTKREESEVTAGSGATFTAVSAFWVAPNLNVIFKGLAGRIDEGYISVSSDIGSKHLEAKAASNLKTF